MSRFRSRHLFIAVLALCCDPITSAQTPDSAPAETSHREWREVANWIPPSSNAVLAIDAESMFQSEFAQKNGWRESHAESFDQNPTMLPPVTKRFLLATELDVEHLEPTHELALIVTTTPVTFDEIKARVEGQADMIAGLPSIHTLRDSYVLQVDEQIVTIVRQASRQWAARQVRDAQLRAAPAVSGILLDAIDQVAAGDSQIVIAVDLTDAVTRSAMSIAMRRSSVFDQTADSTAAIIDEMTGLKGIVFSIRISDRMRGSISMVFDTQPNRLAAVAKPIMLELLADAGAVLPEFHQWDSVFRTGGLELQGELTVAGLRRVLSLLSVDPTGFQRDTAKVQAPESPKISPETVRARATANYVKRVTRLVDAMLAGGKANNLREQVLWTDRSAKAISRMSTRNVEYETAELGRQIAYGMLGIVSAYQEADQKARARIASENPPPVQWYTELIPYRSFVTPQGRFYRYRPYSYAQVLTEQNAINSRQIVSEELASANERAKEMIAGIEDNVSQLNRNR